LGDSYLEQVFGIAGALALTTATTPKQLVSILSTGTLMWNTGLNKRQKTIKKGRSIQLSRVIDRTPHYEIIDELFVCCDEHQFRYYCKAHQERMDCQFCAFDPYAPCDCPE
jgi:hypothetical protein